MHSLAQDHASGLLKACEPPCLSLYQSTHRHHPSKRQDPLRFKRLVKSLEESLLQAHPKRDVETLIEPFRKLADDQPFWNRTGDGLAVLGARGFFRVYLLQRPVRDLAVVADSFHMKPLLRVLQSADRYQILSLSRQQIRLFEGNRDALGEIELAPGVPRTVTEALGEEHTEKYQAIFSYGSGTRGPAMHHGTGAKKDDVDLDAERFFRAVDRALLEHHSRPSGLPLLLAALPEYHKLFREVSHNSYLMDVGLEANPESLDLEQLRERAWQVVLPQYLARLESLVEEFGTAESKGRGTGDVAGAARAAFEGRVRILLVDADRHLPGRVDLATGAIELGEPGTPGFDDLLDDVCELVLSKGGKVVVVPTERMPTDSGLAAIFFY